MRVRVDGWIRGLGLSGLLVLASVVQAADPELPLCRAYDPAEDVLNPAGDSAKRQASLESLVAASKDQGYARHQLGSLYRLGRAHPAGLLDRDVTKAKALLARAALDGYLMAMAGMAEIELRADRPMDAMVWAQAYVHFKRRLEPVPEHYTQAYPADLLDRIYGRLGRSSAIEAEIAEYVSAFVATHGPKIEAAHGKPSSGTATCRSASQDLPTQRIADDKGRFRVLQTRASRAIHSPGLVLFKLVIAPDGQVANVMVMDSLPDEAAAEGLRESVERMRFNPVAGDSPMRVVLLPMSFDDRSVRLRD
jgi:hypothetical protein